MDKASEKTSVQCCGCGRDIILADCSPELAEFFLRIAAPTCDPCSPWRYKERITDDDDETDDDA